MSHTPGPWIVASIFKNHQEGGFWDARINYTHDNGSGPIATVEGCHSTQEAYDQVQANARLIAAAPTMAEALHEVLLFLERAPDTDDPDHMRVYQQIKAALAKAEGRA